MSAAGVLLQKITYWAAVLAALSQGQITAISLETTLSLIRKWIMLMSDPTNSIFYCLFMAQNKTGRKVANSNTAKRHMQLSRTPVHQEHYCV